MSTKSDNLPDDEVCSPSALAPSTPSTPDSPPEPPGPSSLRSTTLGPRSPRRSSQPNGMRLTERDRHIIELVFRTRVLRDDQIQLALFSAGAASRCQRRLTLLVRHRYLDRLPRQTVNEPAIYLLNRRTVAGNRLIRESFGGKGFRQHLGRLGSVHHLLAVNDIRVRVERACRDLGWSLKLWHRPEELAPMLAADRLVPDAYFQIQRLVDGQERTTAFFLEIERAAKSSGVLRSKLRRYGELYYGGRYQQIFDTRALRVLLVFATSSDGSAARRVEVAVGEAKRLGVTIARFTHLNRIRSIMPVACFTSPVWREPTNLSTIALFGQADR